MVEMVTVAPSIDGEAFRQELIALMTRYADKMPAEMQLAFAASVAGAVAACMDPSKCPPRTAEAIIRHNLRLGNASMARTLMGQTGMMQ